MSPPIPEPQRTPTRCLSTLAKASPARPASSSALFPLTKAYLKQSSKRRSFFLSIYPSLSEVPDLSCNFSWKIGGVKPVNWGYTGRSFQKLIVKRIIVISKNRAKPHSSNDDAFFGVGLARHSAASKEHTRSINSLISNLFQFFFYRTKLKHD